LDTAFIYLLFLVIIYIWYKTAIMFVLLFKILKTPEKVQRYLLLIYIF